MSALVVSQAATQPILTKLQGSFSWLSFKNRQMTFVQTTFVLKAKEVKFKFPEPF